MGVEFYPCEDCGETFADCGDYSSCETCGVKLCKGCASSRGISGRMTDMLQLNAQQQDRAIRDWYQQCPYCAREEATDSDLLAFALQGIGVERDVLLARYRDEKKSK